MTSDKPKTDVPRGRAEGRRSFTRTFRGIHRKGCMLIFFHLTLHMYIGTSVMYMPGVSRPFVGLSSDLISFRIAAYIPDSSVQAAAMETGLTGFNGASRARVRDGRTCDPRERTHTRPLRCDRCRVQRAVHIRNMCVCVCERVREKGENPSRMQAR